MAPKHGAVANTQKTHHGVTGPTRSCSKGPPERNFPRRVIFSFRQGSSFLSAPGRPYIFPWPRVPFPAKMIPPQKKRNLVFSLNAAEPVRDILPLLPLSETPKRCQGTYSGCLRTLPETCYSLNPCSRSASLA